VVFGLVHLEDRVAHDLAHHVGVAGGGEELAVTEHGLHRVERVDGEHGRELGGDRVALDAVVEPGHRPDVLLEQRRLRP
jgi:hypothetical protein